MFEMNNKGIVHTVLGRVYNLYFIIIILFFTMMYTFEFSLGETVWMP